MERGEFRSGGSGGAGGGTRTSSETGDDGSAAEARPGLAQRDCIRKRVREKLTFLKQILYHHFEKDLSYDNVFLVSWF